MSKLDDTMRETSSIEETVLEILKEMEAEGLVGSFFDEESGELLWYLKEKLH